VKKWKVQYQSTPFNFTQPGVLVIEANSKEDAFITAYSCLTLSGHAVWVYKGDIESMGLESGPVIAALDNQTGPVHIRSIDEYNVQAPGKVLITCLPNT
jgi:hypothetical protein